RKTFDRYLIVIVEIDKFPEFKMFGERSCFRGDSFHQITVRTNSVNVMIDKRKFFFVELCSEMCRSHCHADAVGETLAQRTGGNFHTRSQSIFGMPWRFGAPLAKAFELIERKIVAGEIKQ